MKTTTDTEILLKTIHMQSCIIEGHSLEAIFRTESEFIRGHTGAKVVSICLQNKKTLELELVLDHDGFLQSCFKRNNLHPQTLILETLHNYINTEFNQGVPYLQSPSLTNFLIDSIAQNKITEIERQHHFKSMVTYPLYSASKQLLGCLMYCYFDESVPNHNSLMQITNLTQTLLRPFHNGANNIFHVKCNQVSTEMPHLTSQEKRILKKLLKAKPYMQIAEEMHISINTVKTHLKNIYAKYNVKSKMELYSKVKGINE